MISKTFKIGVCVIAICSITFVTAQEGGKKKKGNAKELFKKLDTDANGSLSLEEFEKIRKKDNHREAMFDKRFKTLDADANGNISLEEFASKRKIARKKLIEKRFAKLDVDANESIDKAEYQAFIEQAKKQRGKRKRKRHKKED